MVCPYHRLTRADTVLTGRNASILRQSPWKYGEYSLRVFPYLNTFLLRKNCFAPASDGFSSDFWLSSRRRADARQGKKSKKRRKGALAGAFALVNQWYRRRNYFFAFFKALAPPTISAISVVMAAWRTRLSFRLSSLIRSPVASVAVLMAVMRDACSLTLASSKTE